MLRRLFVFFAAGAFAAALFAEEFSSPHDSPVRAMTREQIEQASISSMEELLEKMGLETICFSPVTSAYGGTAVSRNTVFVIDGIRQAAFDSGEFDILLLDVSLIERIEIRRGVFADDKIFTGGNVVKIETRGDSAKKFNFSCGLNSYANAVSGFNASLMTRAGLQSATMDVFAFGSLDENNFKYQKDEFSPDFSTSKKKLSGEGFYNAGGAVVLSVPFQKGSFSASDRFALRKKGLDSSLLDYDEAYLRSRNADYLDDLLLGNFFSANFDYGFSEKISMSAALSNSHYSDRLSFLNYQRGEHWQNTAFAQVSARFDLLRWLEFDLWANCAAGFNSLADDWLRDLRVGTALRFAPCDCVRIDLPFAAYYDEGDFNWTPKIRATYLKNSFFASAGAGKFFVPLNFYESLWNGRIQGENGYSAEISVGFSRESSIRASFFANYYKDKVAAEWNSDGLDASEAILRRREVGMVERDAADDMFFGQDFALGFSLGADCRLSETFSARLSYGMSWNSICDDKLAIYDDGFVDYIPVHNFAFGFNAAFRNLRLDFSGHFSSARLESSFFHDSDDEVFVASIFRKAYFAADLALRYRIADFEIYAKAQNLFSTDYWKHGAQPGKPAMFSLRFNYSFR